MESIKIKNDDSFLKNIVSEDKMPERFSVATNLILICDNGKEAGFMLFDYEPDKWNQWYPYFVSINGEFNFKGGTYGQLTDIFKEEILLSDQMLGKNEHSKKNILRYIGLQAQCEVIEDVIEPEYWLKFSKTANVWTLYYIEFHQISSNQIVQLDVLDKENITIMPIRDDIISNVVDTGQYEGKDVVDNTISILRDKQVMGKLLEHTISVVFPEIN